jgi:hypothetical protein
MDDDIDWDAFQERAHHRTNEIIRLRQHVMDESNDSLFNNLTLLPTVNDKPIWHVKCWVSLLVVIL